MKPKELNGDPWVMDVRMKSEVLLLCFWFFFCRGTATFPLCLLHLLFSSFHRGLFLACPDSVDLQDVMLEHL